MAHQPTPASGHLAGQAGPAAERDHPDGAARPVVIARADGEHGELVLRRRGTILELVVDGVFAMDSAHTDTEVALAELALARLTTRAAEEVAALAGPRSVAEPAGWRVLVGGLGLGFTLRAVLADERVARVDVVELQPRLVEWVRAALVPTAAGLLDDPRVRVQVDDVRAAVGRVPAAGVDAILLDVDNGPGFLVHEDNDALYRTPFLRDALRALTPGGVLAVWSAEPDPALTTRLAEAVRLTAASDVAAGDVAAGDVAAGGIASDGIAAGGVEEVRLEIERDGRALVYAVHLARRPPVGRSAPTTGR